MSFSPNQDQVNAAKILAESLDYIAKFVSPGISTKALNDLLKSFAKSKASIKFPFSGYHGYPEVSCICINDEVTHGMPSKKRYLANGDNISIDFGVDYKGMVADAARTYFVGEVPNDVIELRKNVINTMLHLEKSIKAGDDVAKIGNTISSLLEPKYSIIKEYGGHGIGTEMHMDPWIANYASKATGYLLRPGDTICIEPMVVLGRNKIVHDKDGWTVRTKDGSRAVLIENTYFVTKNGLISLTDAQYVHDKV